MRKLLFASLILTTALITGGALAAIQAQNLAGPITGTYKEGINGTFHLEVENSGLGILTNGWGGACILFRAKDLGFTKMAKKVCTKQSDCSIPGESDGYCHVATGQCWAKPVKPNPVSADENVCNRYIEGSPEPLEAGVWVSIADEPIQLAPLHVAKGAQARVLTCLNGIPGGGCPGLPGAAPPITNWGPPKQL